MAHAGGRPCEFRSEYIAKADEYLATRKDRFQGKGRNRRITVKLPTIEEFAVPIVKYNKFGQPEYSREKAFNF